MEKQLIIAIGREYGTGGHKIAEKLAYDLKLPLYNRNILEEIAKKKAVTDHDLHKYDEVPRRWFLSRSVRGYSNSPEEVVARMQFDFLKEKAASGESFVVVGRCAEDILKDYDGLISLFVYADKESRIKQVAETRHVSLQEAESIMIRHDKKRKAYHNYYCQTSWGDARNYDMAIDVSKLDLNEVVELLEDFIEIHKKYHD